MKSAYDRALERFGGIRELDQEKKERIAEIDRIFISKIVGLELNFHDKISQAKTSDEHDELTHRMRAEISSLKEKAEKRKEDVRCD